ncbi:hypothetical protein F4778DRAFT_740897 [Xylariomycetidae sp. FL2044]|nr:hypothetical protein F4778DRAFT_740897 [Xylariomycetidae sp. FL2044]
MNLKMPDVKKRQRKLFEAAAATAAESSHKSTATATKASTSASSSKTIATLPAAHELREQIPLEGDETDEVPVFDTCDEIRRKINAHLKTPGLTQTQFCRDLYAQLSAPKCKTISQHQLATFRAHRGARTGAKSIVFYAAYVYFERLRLAQGKPETKHREIMEDLWPTGFDLTIDHRTEYITIGGNPRITEFGLVETDTHRAGGGGLI